MKPHESLSLVCWSRNMFKVPVDNFTDCLLLPWLEQRGLISVFDIFQLNPNKEISWAALTPYSNTVMPTCIFSSMHRHYIWAGSALLSQFFTSKRKYPVHTLSGIGLFSLTFSVFVRKFSCGSSIVCLRSSRVIF